MPARTRRRWSSWDYLPAHPGYDAEFLYDALGMQTSLKRWFYDATIGDWYHENYVDIYGPGNLRLFSWYNQDGSMVYTVRDLSGKILRTWEVAGSPPGSQWTFSKDYLYGAEGMFGSYGNGGAIRFFHSDHLGTPRQITERFGNVVGRHSYYPFGFEVPPGPTYDDRICKYTGHERDRNGGTDYMLGRTYLYPVKRFTTVDPGRDGWNLYAYVGGNPVNAVDPNGLYRCTATEAQCSAFETARQANLSREKEIRATAVAYGDPGEDNGVTVSFGATKTGSAANVVPDISFDQESGFRLVTTVTIDPTLSGVLLEAAVGHEGQHLVDAQAFFATITDTGDFEFSKNLTTAQLETNAYLVTHSILKRSNTPMKFRGPKGGVELGRLVSPAELDRAIAKILAGPLYTNILEGRQFPAYAP